jgi:hypothetical protein
MRRQSFERRPTGALDLDLCFECRSIWFDAYESTQLAPRAVIELFRLIHEHGAATARPVADDASCPRCRKRLRFTHDIQGTNRFVYYRCENDHGRLIAFFHFLREKHFVRSLSPVEIERLRATVQQVRCSSCGAPVNVERDAACSFCKTPLAILDADAVGRTLEGLVQADATMRKPPSPTAALDALLEGRRVERRLAQFEEPAHSGFDLVSAAIGLFLDLP